MNLHLRHLCAAVSAPFILSVLGCTSSQTPPTPPKLEIAVSGTSIDRIKTTLVSEMQKRKFRVTNETPSEMSFEQPASDAVIQSLSEADVGKAPIERITYLIKPVAGEIHVSTEVAVIGKVGSAPDKKVDISQSAEAQSIQSVLDKVPGNKK